MKIKLYAFNHSDACRKLESIVNEVGFKPTSSIGFSKITEKWVTTSRNRPLDMIEGPIPHESGKVSLTLPWGDKLIIMVVMDSDNKSYSNEEMIEISSKFEDKLESISIKSSVFKSDSIPVERRREVEKKCKEAGVYWLTELRRIERIFEEVVL